MKTRVGYVGVIRIAIPPKLDYTVAGGGGVPPVGGGQP